MLSFFRASRLRALSSFAGTKASPLILHSIFLAINCFKYFACEIQGDQKITLNGEQALKYVQSRKGLKENDNISRMERQKQYLTTLFNKAVEASKRDEDFIMNASLKLSDYIVSDRSVTQLRELAKKLTEYEFCGVAGIDGELKKGEQYMEFYPNADALKKVVIENFYKVK